jgi:hypothetical protein
MSWRTESLRLLILAELRRWGDFSRTSHASHASRACRVESLGMTGQVYLFSANPRQLISP